MKKSEKIFNILFSLLLLIAPGLYLYRGPSFPKTGGTLHVIPQSDEFRIQHPLIVFAVSENKNVKLEQIAVSHDIVDVESAYQEEDEEDEFGF